MYAWSKTQMPEKVLGKFKLSTRLNKTVVLLQEADCIEIKYNSAIKDIITCETTHLADKCVNAIEFRDFTKIYRL